MDETTKNDLPEAIPYIAFESERMRNDALIRRLVHVIIALIIALVAVVGGFLWYISLPVEVSEEVTVESQATGHATYIGNDLQGDLTYGESDSSENNP